MPPSLQPQSTPGVPLALYEQCVREGKLKNDDAQRNVIAKLQSLYEELSRPLPKQGLLQKMLSRGNQPVKGPRSIYIWGAVGRGKSLLMDLFFGTLPLTDKRRIHFHAFMQEVHAASHLWRKEIEAKQLKAELLPSVAHDIAQTAQVLCLDELQVTDVADAMILSKLFTALLGDGVTTIITSNRPPEELYLGGLQREKFMDFVHLIYDRMDVLELASPHDYRMQQIRAMQAVYMWPLSAKADSELARMLAQLTHQAELQPMTLDIQGHKLNVPQSYGGIARFHFADLCERSLGAADYLTLARRFHTLFISDIPKLGVEKRNEARRFITLIDTFYDHRVKLICTAAAEPAQLYASGDGSFEFQRTISRLAEMQSEQYLNTSHIP
jgi:cell division protein ZapE